MDFFVIEWKHHFGFAGDALQDGVALNARNERQHVRLDDTQLCFGALVDRIDVFDRSLGIVHPQLDIMPGDQRFHVQPELVISALGTAGHDPHVDGAGTPAADRYQADQDQQSEKKNPRPWGRCASLPILLTYPVFN